MPVDPRQVETIFHRAQALSPAERAAFLDVECADDSGLRDRVDRLLAAHDELGEFLNPKNPIEPTTADYRGESHGLLEQQEIAIDGSPRAGSLIAGKYKLIEEIGEGGMGSVWMAQQTEPVKRNVAIKLIKAGMDSRAVLARFEAERQALALMDHPNIAKVLDAGATLDGRPFFVMELVKGIPITQFCDERRLTPRERLELFVPVCQAIQHAHQKGIIHRDIKPNNVLVALYDDRPVPKVIDFGVAKATGQPLTEKTLATGFGAVVGTPEYMSPEQAGFNNLDIDTRSDVYSLGVLLYELLAGSPPFARKELEMAGLIEILRFVREVEPPKPSTKLSTADALPSLSASRGTEPKRLTALLRGELDWIVMKSLEKDRNRRYESANGFAADLQRYLAGEPVTAVPPSAGYRLRKFLRRNQGPVTAASVVFLALAVGIVGTTWGLIRADAARREEAEQRQTAERLRIESDSERARAEDQKRLAEHRAAGLTVDAALGSLGTKSVREGLVRLAGTLKSLPPDTPALRQAVVANLLVWGQDIAPFRTFDGSRLIATSPDGRITISMVRDNWEVRDRISGMQLALLAPSESGEILYDNSGGFSSDGTRAVMVETRENGKNSIRIWNTRTWKEIAQIRLPYRLTTPVAISPDGSRIAAGCEIEPPPPGSESRFGKSVIRLWDGRNGQLVTTLEPGDARNELLEFSPDGEFILSANGKAILLWSSENGTLKHALRGHADDVGTAAFSPSQRWLAVGAGRRVYWWDWQTAALVGAPVEIAADLRQGDGDEIVHFEFTTEDTLIVRVWNVHGVSFGRNVGAAVCVRGHAQSYSLDAVSSDGRYVLTDDGLVFALNPLRRLETPPGRRFPPEVHQAALGERFAQLGTRLVDLVSEKPVGPLLDRPRVQLQKLAIPGCALVLEIRAAYGRMNSNRLVPTPDIPLSDEVLDLWARTLARGHLDPDSGLFVEDDETVWERNRQALLRHSVQVGDFPFPGSFATDRYFWLRQALDEEKETAKMLALIDRLIAIEPSWQNHQHRAYVLYMLNRHADAIRSDLKARELAGPSYINDNTMKTTAGAQSARDIITDPRESKENYEVALKFLETVFDTRFEPQNFTHMIYHALALYRLGRIDEAQRLLAQVDQYTASVAASAMMSPFAAVVASQYLERQQEQIAANTMARVIQAMCYQQKDQSEKAREVIAGTLAMIRDRRMRQPVELRDAGVSMDFQRVIYEALRGIENEK